MIKNLSLSLLLSLSISADWSDTAHSLHDDDERSNPSEDNKLNSASVDSADILNTSDLRDAMVCEAIRRAHKDLDEEIKQHTNSGSTATSLYMQWEDSKSSLNNKVKAGTVSKPVRVFCSNVGDSRCVMLRSYDTVSALKLPSSYSSTTTKPTLTSTVRARADSTHSNVEEPRPVRGPTFFSSSPSKNSESSFLKMKSQSRLSLSPLSSNRDRVDNTKRFTALHLMSEDHKLTLSRERMRITKHYDAEWHTLPASASPIYLPAYARTAPPDIKPKPATAPVSRNIVHTPESEFLTESPSPSMSTTSTSTTSSSQSSASQFDSLSGSLSNSLSTSPCATIIPPVATFHDRPSLSMFRGGSLDNLRSMSSSVHDAKTKHKTSGASLHGIIDVSTKYKPFSFILILTSSNFFNFCSRLRILFV